MGGTKRSLAMTAAGGGPQIKQQKLSFRPSGSKEEAGAKGAGTQHKLGLPPSAAEGAGEGRGTGDSAPPHVAASAEWSEAWADKFRPSAAGDLVVHKKKARPFSPSTQTGGRGEKKGRGGALWGRRPGKAARGRPVGTDAGKRTGMEGGRGKATTRRRTWKKGADAEKCSRGRDAAALGDGDRMTSREGVEEGAERKETPGRRLLLKFLCLCGAESRWTS